MIFFDRNNFEIRTRRLTLVPQNVKYLYSTHEYASDAELTKYMIYLPNKTLADTLEFLLEAERDWSNENQRRFEFAVLLGERHIGGVSVYIDETFPDEGELGWLLLGDCHGLGYATEAALALKEFAFDTLGLSKIFARCDARNTASRRVMEKIGMTIEDDTGVRCYQDSGDHAKELKYSLRRFDEGTAGKK